jgi:hypothetical protein
LLSLLSLQFVLDGKVVSDKKEWGDKMPDLPGLYFMNNDG